MDSVLVQSLLCALIALWGLAMIVIGMVWANWVWALFGIAVLIVGLPFLRNALRSTYLQRE
jgi:hypothetical protein